MMARLYGIKENIDKDYVKDFFDKRAEKTVESLMTITSFQDKENLDKRQEEESKIILENIDLTGKKILEIGCGIGRWAELFHDKCDTYLGLDFAKNLIEIAKEHYNYENCYFQVMSAVDIKIDELLVKPPFDVIFIAGVLVFLNDDDIPQMINQINKLIDNEKTIYIRETISVMDTRLTLKDFYSENLESDYSAIYRTKNELLNFFDGFKDVNTIENDSIFETLKKYDETGYMYFIIK